MPLQFIKKPKRAWTVTIATSILHKDSERCDASEEPEDQTDTAEKLSDNRQQGKHGRNPRTLEVSHGALEAGTAEPAQYLLRTVGEEYDSKRQPDDGKRNTIRCSKESVHFLLPGGWIPAHQTEAGTGPAYRSEPFRGEILEAFRTALTRRIRYKITRGGLLFTFAILVVGFGAIVSANNLLFLIVATMMATLLVSGFVSRLCLAALELDFLVPEHVPAGPPCPGQALRSQPEVADAVILHPSGGIREPNSPVLKSGVYFPLIAEAPPSRKRSR